MRGAWVPLTPQVAIQTAMGRDLPGDLLPSRLVTHPYADPAGKVIVYTDFAVAADLSPAEYLAVGETKVKDDEGVETTVVTRVWKPYDAGVAGEHYRVIGHVLVDYSAELHGYQSSEKRTCGEPDATDLDPVAIAVPASAVRVTTTLWRLFDPGVESPGHYVSAADHKMRSVPEGDSAEAVALEFLSRPPPPLNAIRELWGDERRGQAYTADTVVGGTRREQFGTPIQPSSPAHAHGHADPVAIDAEGAGSVVLVGQGDEGGQALVETSGLSSGSPRARTRL